MADDIFDALNSLPGDSGDAARTQFANAPLANETQDDVSARQYAADTATRQWGRVKASDLNSRGIPNYTDTSGNTKAYTDSTGAPLTDSDPTHGVAYDSSGNAVTYTSRNPTRTPVVKDAYEGAPQYTDKQGNIYAQPAGLAPLWKGTDPDVAAAWQQQQTDRLNQQTSTALAPVEQQAKIAATQSARAVAQSAKLTSQAFTQAGASLSDENGEPIDLKSVDGPALKSAISASFDKEYAQPAANESPWFGSGQYSSAAQAIRADIDNRKQQAMGAADVHIQKLTAAQDTQSQFEQIQQQRISLQTDHLNTVNAQRMAKGLPPVSIPGMEPAQTAGPVGSNDPVGQASGNVAGTGSATTPGSAPLISGLEPASSEQPATNAGIPPEEHPKLAAAMPAPAQQVLAPPKVDADGKVQPEGFWQTVGRAFGTKILPAIATAAGGAAGALVGGAAGIETGPGAIATAVAGDIAGGAAAGYAANKAQRAVMGDKWADANDAQLAANAQAHPVATQLGMIAPFLISALGGGGGAVASKAITQGGKQAVEEAVATGAQALARRATQLGTTGARVGASEGAQQPGATPGSVLDSTARTALEFGATALFPASKVILGGAGLAKPFVDSLAMPLASQVYDAAIHGKPMDLQKLSDQTAGNVPVFLLQHAILGFLGHGMAANMGEPPSPGEKPITGRVIPPDEGGSGSPAIPGLEPEAPKGGPGGAPPEATPPTPSEKLNIIDTRLQTIAAAEHPAAFDAERESLLAQKDALRNARTQPTATATEEAPHGQQTNLSTVEGAENALAQADPEGGMRSIRALRNVVPDPETRRQIILDRLQERAQQAAPPESAPAPSIFKTAAQNLTKQFQEKAPVQLQRLTDLHAEGFTAQEIANKLGLDASIVRQLRSGLDLPSQGRPMAGMGATLEGDPEAAQKFEQWAAAHKAKTSSQETAIQTRTAAAIAERPSIVPEAAEIPPERSLEPIRSEHPDGEAPKTEGTVHPPIAPAPVTAAISPTSQPSAGSVPNKEKPNEPTTATPTQENAPGSQEPAPPSGETQLEPGRPPVDEQQRGEAPERATPESIAEQVQKLRRGPLAPHFKMLQSRLETVGQGFAGPSGLAAHVNPTTEKLEIWHDPHELAASHHVVQGNFEKRGDAPKVAAKKADASLRAGIEEELIHNRQKIFERGGPQFNATYGKLWRERVPQVVREIFQAMRNVKDETDAQKMAELERMIIQYRETGTITEATFGDPFLDRQFERLKPFLSSQHAPEIEDNIARVMTLAAEHSEPQKAKTEAPPTPEPHPVKEQEPARGPPKKPSLGNTVDQIWNRWKFISGDPSQRGNSEAIIAHSLDGNFFWGSESDLRKETYLKGVNGWRPTTRQEEMELRSDISKGTVQIERQQVKGMDTNLFKRVGAGKTNAVLHQATGFPLSSEDSMSSAKPIGIPGMEPVIEKKSEPFYSHTIPGMEHLHAAKPEGENNEPNRRKFEDNPAGTTSVDDQESFMLPAEREARPIAHFLGANIKQVEPGSRDAEEFNESLRGSGARFIPALRTIIWAPIRRGVMSERLARSLFEEEVVHAAQYYVVSKTQATASPIVGLDEMVREKYAAIAGELSKSNRGKAVMVAAQRAYSWGTSEHPFEINTLKQVTDAVANHLPYQLELERQLVQIRKSGQPTEVSMRSAEQMLTRWFQRVLHILKVAAKDPAKASPVLSESIAKVESALRGEDDPLHSAKPDTGKPSESDNPRENLTREAESAGVTLKVEELKGLLRGDESTMNAVRAKIKARTGKDALFAAKPLATRLNELSENTGINSLIDDIQRVLSPDDRLTKEERERFANTGDFNSIGDARKTGMIEDGVTARMARKDLQRIDALREARTLVSKLPDDQKLEFMLHLDEGTPIKPGPYKAVLDALAAMDKRQVDAAKASFDALGLDHWKNFENYINYLVPHYFENADEASKAVEAMISEKKRMMGSTGFLQHREQMSMREIIDWAKGKGIDLKPRTLNIVDAMMMRWRAQDRYIGAHEMIQAMERNGTGHWVSDTEHYVPKAGEKQVNNIIGTRTIEDAAGNRRKQHFYAAEPSATIINNYLSSGLREGHKWIENYFAAANTLNKFQLGLSTFHGIFVTGEGMISSFALGLEKVLRGDFKGFKNMALAPFSTWHDFQLGRDIRKTMLDPTKGSQRHIQIVEKIVNAGFRQGQDSFYNNNDIEKFFDALRAHKVFQTALRAPLALIELVAKPLMEHFVPIMKAAATYKLAEMMLDREPNMDPLELDRQLQEAVRSGNNRFGQMTYDNLHLNKVVKDLLMAVTRSLGWNWGSFAEIGGGVVDLAKFAKNAAIYGGRKIGGGGKGRKPPGEWGDDNGDEYEPGGAKFPRLTHRMVYVLALPLLIGFLGAVLTAMFGQKIERLRDYYAIKTGEVDDHGHPVRVMLPSYMKDVLSFSHNPMQAVINKLHPILSIIGQMLQNKDFFGVEIRHSGDPVMKQILQDLRYAGEQITPFSIRNAQKLKGSEVSTGLKAATVTGALLVAPSYAGKSDAQNLADELVREGISPKARTSEQAEHSKLVAQITGLERIGKGADLMQQSLSAGNINAHDVARIQKQAHLTPLQASVAHLNLQDAEKVAAVATPAEQAQLRPMIAAKEMRADRRPRFSGF